MAITIEEVGQRIKAERLRQGMSVSHLANKCGVATSVVYRLENGDGIHLGSFVSIMTALKASYTAIFAETITLAVSAAMLRQVAEAMEDKEGIDARGKR